MKNKLNKKLDNYARRQKKEFVANLSLRIERYLNTLSDDQIFFHYKKYCINSIKKSCYGEDELDTDRGLKIFHNWCYKNNKISLSEKVTKLFALRIFC